MSTEDNKQLAHRHTECWNQGNLALIEELLAPDFTPHHPNRPDVRSREDSKRWFAAEDGAAPPKGGIPGMRGVEHIGLTVPNLEEATEFFVNVLGCEVVYSLYPPRRADNYLDLHPETDRKIRTLSCRNGAHFELFEYTAPDQNKHMPKSSDYGGHHVTFYVDDMDAAIAYLKSKGVYLFGEKRYGYGAEAGKDSTFVHFKTPWGLVLELVSFPNGRAYEQEKPVMWKPEPVTS